MFWNDSMLAKGSSQTLLVDDVFSTDTYVGTGATPNNIVNGLDMAQYGGAILFKRRDQAVDGAFVDTVRGPNLYFASSSTAIQVNSPSDRDVTSFNSNGFSLGNTGAYHTNTLGNTHVAWSFRRAPKFFDVVTYTGTGALRTVPHNLGSVPGAIMIRRVDGGSALYLYHKDMGATQTMIISTNSNSTTSPVYFNNTAPTSTEFTVNTNAGVNANGGSYVAYIFAHDDSADGIIQCGSYVGNGTQDGSPVNLGWEPQFLFAKCLTGSMHTVAIDSIRGFGSSESPVIHTSNPVVEQTGASYITSLPTGFRPTVNSGVVNTSSSTYIYIAIRASDADPANRIIRKSYRGISYTATAADRSIVNGIDLANDGGLVWIKRTSSSTSNHIVVDSVRGPTKSFAINASNSEVTNATAVSAFTNSGFNLGTNSTPDPPVNINATHLFKAWTFKKQTRFLDIVQYTGDGQSIRSIPHSLGVQAGLVIIKGNLNASIVGANAMGENRYLTITSNAAAVSNSGFYRTADASTFTVGNNTNVNGLGTLYTAYVFAHDIAADGIIQVGTYVGTGSGGNTTVNLGWTPQLLFIKRVDGVANWVLTDSENRGFVVYPSSTSVGNTIVTFNELPTGFQIADYDTTTNISGSTYLYMAIRKQTR